MKNQKNESWKRGIILVCIAFATLMTSLGIMASHHHIDLVVSDYYKAEINYQKQINKMNNYKALGQKPSIIIDSFDQRMMVTFPDIKVIDSITGRISLYRPDNQKYDDTLDLHLNEQGMMNIPLEKYRKGHWTMRMEWQVNQLPYYIEKKFVLK